MGGLRLPSDPRLLVGIADDDDAGVYALSDELALVQTADFITPIVDDPFTFGEIAAANALSDIYAMGGKPLTALNLCCFPESGVDPADLAAILEGALSKLGEAETLLVGGHTVRDRELKFGLAVTGTIHPKDIKANRGAKAGDVIVLTKSLGTGVLTTAARKGELSDALFQPAIDSMRTLNDRAARRMVECQAHAATDITGFGFVVHLLEVARASKVRLRVDFSALPFFPGVRQLSKGGVKTGMAAANEKAATTQVTFADTIVREDRLLLFDPQTSGGLAVFLPPEKVERYLKDLWNEGIEAHRIGSAEAGDPHLFIAS